jgi:hypothetical protein
MMVERVAMVTPVAKVKGVHAKSPFAHIMPALATNATKYTNTTKYT